MSMRVVTPAVRILSITAVLWGLADPHAGDVEATDGEQPSSMRSIWVTINAEKNGWAFPVLLDTDRPHLRDDIMNNVVLVMDDGRELKPAVGKGVPPDGHDQEWTLEFSVAESAPQSLGLRMQRSGDAEASTFHWAV